MQTHVLPGHLRHPSLTGGTQPGRHPGEILRGIVGAIAGWIKKNAVLAIACLAAAVTCFLVPPDAAYKDYFDWKTLSCLYCVLAVVMALRHVRFFTCVAQMIVRRFETVRSMTLILVYVTFIGSMLIANDMALLTFLPLGFLILENTGWQKYMAYVFVLQNIAANLGGMLTPFGNPQNLYLYTRFSIPNAEFVRVMLPPFLLAIAMITVCCCMLPAEKVRLTHDEEIHLPRWRTLLYLILFALSIVIVFRVLPYWIGLLAVTVMLLWADCKALREVDYPLLGTFTAFFIFSGNMSRLTVVRSFLEPLLEKRPMLYSALCCQCISNVPSAVLLSQFTSNWKPLLLGVNIGGTGTLIASLASLITYREYVRHNPNRKLYYFGVFTAMNVLFFAVMLLFERLLGVL